MPEAVDKNTKALDGVARAEVDRLFAKRASELHRKVDATRDAYLGFIFPINRDDFTAVTRALNIGDDAARAIYARGTAFSSFKKGDRRGGSLTNHIFGASILALRGKSLDTGLASVTDKSLGELVGRNEETVLEIAEARSSWFGRIYFPAVAFSNAIGVFGGKVSPDAVFALADKYGYAAIAGERKTVRGDFGIGVWLTLLGTAA